MVVRGSCDPSKRCKVAQQSCLSSSLCTALREFAGISEGILEKKLEGGRKGRKAWIWPQNQYRQEVLHCQHLSTKHWLCVTSSPRIPHAELAGAEGSLENQQDVPKYSGLRNTCVKSSFCGAEGDEVPQSLSEGK